MRIVLAGYNLEKNPLRAEISPPLTSAIKILASGVHSEGIYSILKQVPFLARDIFLEFLAPFVPGLTQFLQHF